ncbi:MAG: signal recognition particle protein [candidate division NC10 bacterium]|nr:signal recognition particle protein [candidate division NC10 bacterium]
MFESLAEKFEKIFRKLRGYGRLTEENIGEALREVRLALLEADVHFRVVKEFLEEVKKEAIGREVLESLTPGQQVIKVVYDRLVSLLGEEENQLLLKSPPSPIMLVGLQGSGKTTTAAKLALWLQKRMGRKGLLVAADPRRPAAKEQLKTLGRQLGVPVFAEEGDAVKIARDALSLARSQAFDAMILDTGGRLHIDAELMRELKEIKSALNPSEILMVADAMTGQDAVKSVSSFNAELDLTGVVLTKLDGDAKGGAALSVRAVTGKPIKFVGTGEKAEALEVFYPARMASRILGMGDVLTLVERAEQAFDQKKSAELQRKMQSDSFTLEDFRDQLQSLKAMGPLDQWVRMIPGLSRMSGMAVDYDHSEIKRVEAIINSMTPRERLHAEIINGSRRRRIAQGSGTSVAEVNKLLKGFLQMQKALRQWSKGGKRWGGFRLPTPL